MSVEKISIKLLWDPFQGVNRNRIGPIAEATVIYGYVSLVATVRIDERMADGGLRVTIAWPDRMTWESKKVHAKWNKKVRDAFVLAIHPRSPPPPRDKAFAEEPSLDELLRRSYKGRGPDRRDAAERAYQDYLRRMWNPGGRYHGEGRRTASPPPPPGDGLPWADLGLRGPVPQDEAKRAYHAACRAAHPDLGGSHERQVRINRAWQRICQAMHW